MIKKLYIAMLIAGATLLSMGCSDDPATQTEETDENQVTLSAAMTRANGDNYPNLYLKAFAGTADTSAVYIEETPFSIPAGLYEETSNPLVFTAAPYYPIGNNEISFYAYTGKLQANGRVYLTSGRALTNDALLSNHGYRDGAVGLTPEGRGTPGNKDNPAEILQFRHLMTQLNVIIKVDSTEQNFVDPPPKSIRFTMGDDIRLHGTYDITKPAPVEGDEANAYVAQNRSGQYTMHEGVNYVVPNGKDITTFAFSSLIIDDYEATTTDLAALTITNVDGPSPVPLMVSGYAYNLTFLIRRLEVQSVEISLIPWDATEVTNEDISYDPYVLTMNLGEYENTGDDEIEKVVLFTSDGKEYVGGLENGGIHFVNLPISGMVDSIELYTSLGLLIAMQPDSYILSATNAQLNAVLSSGGMKLEDPNAAPSTDNPYQIATPLQVFNIYKAPNASYKLMNDIDVNRLSYSDTRPLIPLEAFGGVFDGNGHQIQNLIMSGPGLVRRNTGILKNLRVNSGRINAEGEGIAGSICGSNAGTIVACVNEARIVNATNVVGGICGINESTGTIIACLNTGNLDTGVTLGGICGLNENTGTDVFVSCINTGLLTKTGTLLGGILGNSSTTPNVLINTSFWLVGTAAKVFGGPEVPVGGTSDIGIDDVAALSPEKLRNDIAARETEAESTLFRLNTALGTTAWGGEYEFVLEQAQTGSVWPIPVRVGTF